MWGPFFWSVVWSIIFVSGDFSRKRIELLVYICYRNSYIHRYSNYVESESGYSVTRVRDVLATTISGAGISSGPLVIAVKCTT